MTTNSTNPNSKNDNTFELSDLILQKKIGAGSFGKVYKAQKNKTGEIVAVKVSREALNENSQALKDFWRELNIISLLHHPSVLKYYGYSPFNFKFKPKPVIITEYSPNGTLSDLIKSGKSTLLNDTRKLIIIYGIASAMSYLHSNGIIHRDLKPENVLIDEYLFPKIADFGLSKFNQNLASNTTIGVVKGTPLYISPEIWKNSLYTKACDVYAFAIVVYELITNEQPFENCLSFQISYKVASGYRPEFKIQPPKSYLNLIEKCWSQDPLDRPTFDQILDQLKNDRGFITEKVDKEEYQNYMSYIDSFTTSFDSSKRINLIQKYIGGKQKIYQNDDNVNANSNLLNSINNIGFFSFVEFNQLSDKCKKIIEESKNDSEKQFLVSQYLIEGQYDFKRNTQIGLKYLKDSIKNGCIDAIVYYFKMLIKGDVIPKNFKKAKKLIEKRLKDKEDDVYFLLSGILLKKEKKYNDAQKMFEISLQKGNGEAFCEYANIIYKGKCSTISKEQAVHYYKKAIDKGSLKSMFKYGLIMKDQNNTKEAVKYIKLAADKGYLKAIYYYSIMNKKADCVEYNIEESNRYLKKAADKGHLEAMYEYAHTLYGSKSNYEFHLALQLLQNACLKGHLDAMHRYGIVLIKGLSCKRNYYEGINLIKYAAYNGNIEALIEYAKIHLSNNNGLQKDKEEGIECLKKAIDLGSSEAMTFYGKLLSNDENKNIIPTNFQEAIKYLKMAIDLGNGEAMDYYATMLREGKGIEINKEEALKYFEMGIKNENANSMFHYGEMLENGEGIPVNKEKAIIYYKKAIDHNHLQASFHYGIMLLSDNNNEGSKFIKKAANGGDIEAIIHYGFLLQNGIYGVGASKMAASKYFKLAADLGNSSAMKIYAHMLLYGDGIEVNEEEGMRYLKMAVNKGDTEAYCNYGLSLWKGIGVAVNKKEAAKYFQLAIDAGVPEAMVNYSSMLLYDDGTPTAIEEGIKLVKMAMDKKYPDAYLLYGNVLFNGTGMKINKEEAAKYYRIAADNGNCRAMFSYGMMFYEGDGVPKNRIKGYHFIKKAADRNYIPAFTKYRNFIIFDCDYDYDDYYDEVDDESTYTSYTQKIDMKNFIKKAADNGNAESMNQYALCLLKEDEINVDEAAKYFKMSAEKGCIEGMKNYADFLFNGHGVQMNVTEAIHYYKILAEKGDVSSMFKLGKILLNGNGIEANPNEAFKYIKAAAEKGDPEAMAFYGNALFNGNDIPIDKEEGLKFIRKAVACNNPDALLYYGQILAKGDGVPVDKKMAETLIMMSYMSGNMNALGPMVLFHNDDENDDPEEEEEEEEEEFSEEIE